MASAPARAATPKDDARHSGKLLLRMPSELHGELAKAAEREGTSLNAYITQTLAASLNGNHRPAAPPSPSPGPSRFLRIAVIVDLVMVALATAAAVALLIVAWPS
jgi:HicB family